MACSISSGLLRLSEAQRHTGEKMRAHYTKYKNIGEVGIRGMDKEKARVKAS